MWNMDKILSILVNFIIIASVLISFGIVVVCSDIIIYSIFGGTGLTFVIFSTIFVALLLAICKPE